IVCADLITGKSTQRACHCHGLGPHEWYNALGAYRLRGAPEEIRVVERASHHLSLVIFSSSLSTFPTFSTFSAFSAFSAVNLSMPTLSGIVERIVFRNSETHFTVARLRLDDTGRLFRDELLTVVGTLPGINIGEVVDVTGDWEVHPQHGRNLRVVSFQSHAPVTPTGLKRYLGSGVIKGIGPKTAERIVDHFGEQTLAILELEPGRLTEVSGISAHKRDLIVGGWADQRNIRNLMIFLQGHGVSPGLSTKIYRQYGQDAVSVIGENPYLLERDIHGVGFKTADALAVRLGVPRDALPRYMTGIKHVLSEAANADGHCFLTREEMLTRAA